MQAEKFANTVRILLGIDLHELVKAGVISEGDKARSAWSNWKRDPLIFICKLDDDRVAKLWELIESRQPRRFQGRG